MQGLELSVKNTPPVETEELDGICRGKVARKFSTPDLPVELWMKVLSYLPKGFVRRMIGINRVLYEMGMNEIYRKVQLRDYTGAGLKTVEQMRCPDIGCRVLELCVVPEFLPELSKEGKKSWKKLKARKAEIRSFFDTALGSLLACTELQTLTVIVLKQYIPKTFSAFLKKLFMQVGPRIHTLTVSMTWASVLSNSPAFPKHLPSLTSLTIDTVQFPALRWVPGAQRAYRALVELITSTKQSLQFLTLRSFITSPRDIYDLISKLPNLPLLKRLVVDIEYVLQPSFPEPFPFPLSPKKANNLELIAIRQLYVPIERLGTDYKPEVEVGGIFRVVPRGATFSWHLTNVSYWGQHARLTYFELCGTLRRNKSPWLGYLRISVRLLSPDLLDLFSGCYPNLKTLVIRYEAIEADPYSTKDKCNENSIVEAFRKRKYPQWKLRRLEVVHSRTNPHLQEPVGDRYPDARIIDAIVENLPSLTEVIQSWDKDQ